MKEKQNSNANAMNHCTQKNEILVHKGHKHENHSKLCVF